MLNFREPTTARYIYFTQNGDIEVQMPIIGAKPDRHNQASISTDNTCKTLKVIQEFFGVSALSTNASLEKELSSYKQRLEYDLSLIDTLGSKSPAVKAIQERKQKRLVQLKAWQQFFNEVISKPEIASHIHSGAGYSPSIKAIIKDHIYPMVLRPAQIDSFRSKLTPIFDMDRAPFFYQTLVVSLAAIKIDAIKPPKDNKDLLIAAALKSLQGVKLPLTSDGLGLIQRALSEQLPAIYKITNPNFFSSFFDSKNKKQQEITLPYLKSLTLIDDNTTVEECANSLVNLCGSALPQQANQLFYIKDTTPDSLEKLNLTIQFFLGQLNISCVSWKKTTANFATLLEKNGKLARGLIQSITNCMAQGESVESALLSYINTHYLAFSLNAPLTSQQQEKFIPLFQDLYSTIEGSQHLDEFTLLTDENRGVCTHHQGSIVVPFRELANRLKIKLDNNLMFSVPLHSSMVLDNENSALEKDQLNQDIDHMALLNNALSAKPPKLEFIAQLLVSKTVVAKKSQFLFSQISEKDISSITSDQSWAKLRARVTSQLTANQITAFETHFQCMDISLPLTAKMLYALHINLIKNKPFASWITPDHYYRMGGINALFLNNGLQATKVPEYPNPHGTNHIICTPKQKLAIEKMIAENDNQIFVDSGMARAIYIAANEAAGRSDWDVVNGQQLNNKNNKGGIPAKIKRALQLLNIHFSDTDTCSFPNGGRVPGYVFKTSPEIQQEILQLAVARPQLLLTEKMIAAFETYITRLPHQHVRDSGIENISKKDVKARVTCLLNLIGYKTKNIGLSDVNRNEVWVEVHEEVKNWYQWIAEKQGHVTLDDYFNSGLGGRGSSSRSAYAYLESQKLENIVARTEQPRRQISGNGGGLNSAVAPVPQPIPTPLPREIADKLQKLRDKIIILSQYGATLRAYTTSKAQDKGRIIANLVSDLNIHCSNFERDYAQQPDINVWHAFELNFKAVISNNKNELRKYSSNLKPILAVISSIIAAFTVLGTVVLLAMLIKAKKEDGVLSINRACLFGKSRSEQIVDEVNDSLHELDQTMQP